MAAVRQAPTFSVSLVDDDDDEDSSYNTVINEDAALAAAVAKPTKSVAASGVAAPQLPGSPSVGSPHRSSVSLVDDEDDNVSVLSSSSSPSGSKKSKKHAENEDVTDLTISKKKIVTPTTTSKKSGRHEEMDESFGGMLVGKEDLNGIITEFLSGEGTYLLLLTCLPSFACYHRLLFDVLYLFRCFLFRSLFAIDKKKKDDSISEIAKATKALAEAEAQMLLAREKEKHAAEERKKEDDKLQKEAMKKREREEQKAAKEKEKQEQEAVKKREREEQEAAKEKMKNATANPQRKRKIMEEERKSEDDGSESSSSSSSSADEDDIPSDKYKFKQEYSPKLYSKNPKLGLGFIRGRVCPSFSDWLL